MACRGKHDACPSSILLSLCILHNSNAPDTQLDSSLLQQCSVPSSFRIDYLMHSRSIRFFSAIPGLLIIAILLLEGVPIFTYYVPNITRTNEIKARFVESRTTLLTFLHCLHLAYFVVCYVFCIWSYFTCVFTREDVLSSEFIDPGRVTESYIQDYERQFGYEELRYCPVCNQKKPPRCHHCSICKVVSMQIV